MIAFPKCSYVYIDASALKDEAMSYLLPYFAQTHKEIRLCVQDVWEEAEVKNTEAYDYICDTVYGRDIGTVVLEFAAKRKQHRNQILIITYEALQDLPKEVALLTLGEQGEYENGNAFLLAKFAYDRRYRFCLVSIMVVCVIIFTCELLFYDMFPLALKEGIVSFFLFFLPIAGFVLCLSAGLRKGVFQPSILLEILDFI